MKNKTKIVTGHLEKAAGNGDGRFVLYDLNVADRDGDTIAENGIDFKAFKSNPVALWGHDHEKLIGTWSDVKVVGGKILGKLKLATTPLAQLAKKLIEEDILKAVSISFLPKSYDAQYDENNNFLGFHFTAIEMTEASLVSVPAHQNALLYAKSLDICKEDYITCFGETCEAVETSLERQTRIKANLSSTITKINGVLR